MTRTRRIIRRSLTCARVTGLSCTTCITAQGSSTSGAGHSFCVTVSYSTPTMLHSRLRSHASCLAIRQHNNSANPFTLGTASSHTEQWRHLVSQFVRSCLDFSAAKPGRYPPNACTASSIFVCWTAQQHIESIIVSNSMTKDTAGKPPREPATRRRILRRILRAPLNTNAAWSCLNHEANATKIPYQRPDPSTAGVRCLPRMEQGGRPRSSPVRKEKKAEKYG